MIREIRYIFHFQSTLFPTYPENHNTKEGLYFLNRGTKTKLFCVVKVKNDFNMMHISFLLKQLCWCCLDRTFVSLILLGVSFSNSFQLYVVFLSVHWYTEDCFTITESCFKSVYYYFNYIVAPQLIQNTNLIWSYFLLLFLFCHWSLSHWKLLLKHVPY